jgi:predicted NUDIX family NTP pyrophosphohydrolase
MATQSAGLLLFRRTPALEVLLVHPGGPFFKNKRGGDDGSWTIPKGEINPHEDPLAAAIRETTEELGHPPAGPFTPLGTIKQKSGKLVHAWAAESNLDPATIRPNTFEIEWPPRSGKKQTFPEIDRAQWFNIEAAKTKIIPAQIPFLDTLTESKTEPVV